MRFTWIFLLVAAAWIGLPATNGAEPGIGQTFQQRCASCHTMPDLDLRTDRAWIRQVSETT